MTALISQALQRYRCIRCHNIIFWDRESLRWFDATNCDQCERRGQRGHRPGLAGKP